MLAHYREEGARLMELQEIFDRTVRHLHQQGGPAKTELVSRSSGHTMQACAYRGRNGTKCAVGYWIPDDQYNGIIEGHALTGHDSLASPLRRLPEELRTQDAVDLLRGLQTAHDNAFFTPETFRWRAPWDNGGLANRLYAVVREFNLNSRVLTECWPK
jgi:hypothetical protein